MRTFSPLKKIFYREQNHTDHTRQGQHLLNGSFHIAVSDYTSIANGLTSTVFLSMSAFALTLFHFGACLTRLWTPDAHGLPYGPWSHQRAWRIQLQKLKRQHMEFQQLGWPMVLLQLATHSKIGHFDHLFPVNGTVKTVNECISFFLNKGWMLSSMFSWHNTALDRMSPPLSSALVFRHPIPDSWLIPSSDWADRWYGWNWTEKTRPVLFNQAQVSGTLRPQFDSN